MAFYRCSGGTDTSEVTATAEDVLSPKVIVNVDGDAVTGTMTNQGAKTATLNAGGSYTIPKGYHNGSGEVTAKTLSSQTIANATASDIKKGKTAWVNGVKVTGNYNSSGKAKVALQKTGFSNSIGVPYCAKFTHNNKVYHIGSVSDTYNTSLYTMDETNTETGMKIVVPNIADNHYEYVVSALYDGGYLYIKLAKGRDSYDRYSWRYCYINMDSPSPSATFSSSEPIRFPIHDNEKAYNPYVTKIDGYIYYPGGYGGEIYRSNYNSKTEILTNSNISSNAIFVKYNGRHYITQCKKNEFQLLKVNDSVTDIDEIISIPNSMASNGGWAFSYVTSMGMFIFTFPYDSSGHVDIKNVKFFIFDDSDNSFTLIGSLLDIIKDTGARESDYRTIINRFSYSLSGYRNWDIEIEDNSLIFGGFRFCICIE